eukprot:2479863-Pyramimonas_sp.AAC.1
MTARQAVVEATLRRKIYAPVHPLTLRLIDGSEQPIDPPDPLDVRPGCPWPLIADTPKTGEGAEGRAARERMREVELQGEKCETLGAAALLSGTLAKAVHALCE